MKIINIGYLLLIIGTLLISYQYIIERKELIIEKNKIENTLQQQTGYLVKKDIEVYNMILSIPQIKLKKGIYTKEDKRNDIEENIQIHEVSDYPNQDNSNVILIAHSGTGKKAFFKDLEKLNQDSLIELYYNNIKYVYKIDNYYNINKIGTASIKRDKTKKTVTLITCSQSDKTKQLIYISYLIDEIKY